MLPKHALKLLLTVTLVLSWPNTSAVGGTTGMLAGTLRVADGSAVAGARVTAAAPSDIQTISTDTKGYFVFLSLPPDTYTVTSSKSGFDTVSVNRVRVLADNTRVIALITRKTVVLGVLKVKPGGNLLRPGVVADVYSITPEQAEKVQLLGGSNNIDNIYSALATVPGVIVPPFQPFHPFQVGANQVVNIRSAGGEGTGYEYDGVPVNRAFDNQSALVGSKLGQRELQVYVGGAPANAQAFGLGGFVNQVLKTGAYPGFANLDATIQSPTYYNGLSFEIGGATLSRSFSYYLAVGGYNNSPRYFDNFDGASQAAVYGLQLDVVACAKDPTRDSTIDCYQNNGLNGPVGPGGYILGPINMFITSNIADRETVTNLHFRVPHHRDGISDDVQVLYSTSLLRNPVYSSYSDFGAGFWQQDAAAGGGLSSQPWDYSYGYQYQGAVGQPLPGGCAAPCNVSLYSFPSSKVAPGASIPVGLRDSFENADAIVKIQYQHNIGSRSYLRLYGYSYYTSAFGNGPNSASACNAGRVAPHCQAIPSDFVFSAHTRGGSVAYAAQINDKHLLEMEASFVTANSLLDWNSQFSGSQPFAVLVDAKAPLSGLCFKLSGALGSCEPNSNNPADFQDLGSVRSGGVTKITGKTCDPGVAGVPAGPCEWLVVESGPQGPYNNMRPEFTSVSVNDEFRASSKLQLEAGLRVDRFVFRAGDTSGPAREFWFNAWNQNECAASAPGSLPRDKAGDLRLSPAAPCSQLGLIPATMQYASAQVFSYSLLEPRLGGTYAFNDDDLLRFSYNKLAQPPITDNEQTNVSQQNLPASLSRFYPFGLTTSGHALGPSVAYSLDLSWEHRLRGTDLELKLTPYVRKTKDQYVGFTLDPRIGIFAELPAAQQTSEGLEFELQKGDFEKNGLTWLLTYTYYHNLIRYTPLPSGATFQTANNNQIRLYNAYTSYCAANPIDQRCGLPTNGAPTAPCYNASGAAAPACAPGDIANPYWNAPVQSLIRDASFPGGFRHHVGMLVLNYKAGKLAVTPAFQFLGGFRYGDPLAAQGVDPASNCTALAGSTVGDPRYPYGARGGSPYNAMSCRGQVNIPDPYTRIFDGTNAFVEPSLLVMNLQLTYDATSRVQLRAGAANLINACWGGSKELWTVGATNQTCYYFQIGYVGNFFNPDSKIQPLARVPYFGFPGTTPIVLTFQARLTM